jgi:hypothetical protein
MSDSSSRPDSSRSVQNSREENSGEAERQSNALVQDKDMAEIAMYLRHISDVLESSGISRSAAGTPAEESDFWLDDDYLYVDVVHTESEELMMDICVQQGRAFIRVEREGLGVGLVEIPA